MTDFVRRPMHATVTRVRDLSAHLRRVTLTGDQVDRFEYLAPDHLVRIFLPRDGVLELPDSEQWWPALQAIPEQRRPFCRNYTVRRIDHERRELDIDFVLHGDGGPASAWALTVAPGDRIGVLSDGADYAPPADTTWQLLVADETGLPAITAALEALPAGMPAIALLEVDSPADEIPVRVPEGATLTWLHRAGTAPGTSDVVLRTAKELDLPDGTPYAFVAGESGMVTTVRRHLCRDRGVDKDRVYFCGYWKLATSLMETSS
ncbi:siderophore-interacting protein [Actinoplanes sp. LDG1-06]|uniref:Siderophore-interacting protein n=1 Tax=Paractinoplanes ovalisporus TaxID=2810368 RepID=A0ABS2AF02_9ACTN|nr:siderophore-interacting protein [Actinoplanes ovalisporus]MBM2618419.1 siderophore-interacting protein [Actinoplanes ovalisporus]